ncbi:MULTISPECIES: NUDIX hydrolase [unclassified Carboxylicivirga]|uniref:NUDIX hydrolase n=1 Tax=Carboxylicivirga TaxID=1628153 RepID=UPI003D33C0BD
MCKTKPQEVIRFCPRCGSNQFIAQDGKSFKCQDCYFHFFVNSACAVAGIIINEKGEMLLTRRAFDPHAGMLDLPGGFVDPGERAEAALVREIKEELNLEVIDLRFLASYPNEYVFSGYTVYTTDLGFVCRVANFDNMHAQDDISGYEFIHPEAIDFEQISAGSIARLIETYVAIGAHHRKTHR